MVKLSHNLTGNKIVSKWTKFQKDLYFNETFNVLDVTHGAPPLAARNLLDNSVFRKVNQIEIWGQKYCSVLLWNIIM